MKTAYNHLTHSYETPDKTSVAAEICEGDTPSDAFRAAAIREQQRKSATYARTVIDALYENGDPVSVDAAELLEQITQPSKPLTDEQIERIYTRYGGDMMNCARAIEREHGIKGDA